MNEIAVWIALGSLIVNFVAVLITNHRFATRNSEARKEEMLQLERSMREKLDVESRQFGETVAALREKVVQTELWNRDNFIDRETFNMVISDIKDANKRVEDKIDRRFDSLERKLEKIHNGLAAD